MSYLKLPCTASLFKGESILYLCYSLFHYAIGHGNMGGRGTIAMDINADEIIDI